MEAPLPDRGAGGRRASPPPRGLPFRGLPARGGGPEGRTLSLRLGLVLAAAFGIAVAAASVARGASRAFDFETFFNGRLTGRGVVDNRRDGTHRPFTATIAARWTGPRGSIIEDLAYSDGETKRLSWTFERTAAGRYVGRRDDLVGDAEAIVENGTLRMTYAARTRLPSGRIWTLSFDDRFEQVAEDTVIVTGAVSYLFIGVGATHMTIVKAP